MKSVTNLLLHIKFPDAIHSSLYVSDTQEIMEDWNARKARLKEKFSKLSEANTTRLAHEQEELISRLQKRLGATRETILKLLAEL